MIQVKLHENTVQIIFGKFGSVYFFHHHTNYGPILFVFFFLLNRQIVDSSKEFRRSPTQILLDEWGTSGKKRATVSDLLELLIKVQLYRAADFVAKDILHEAMPKRPEHGPSARIDITLPNKPLDEAVIEKLLNNVSYPCTSQLAAQLIERSIDSLINNNNRDISNAISVVERHKSIFNSSGEVTPDQYESESDTDLIKFSASGAADNSSATIDTTSKNDYNNVSIQTPTSTTVFSTEMGPASLTLTSSSVLQMNSCNLPTNLPMANSNSDNLSNHVVNAVNENELTISSSSSISSSVALSDTCSYTCSSGNQINQSTLIPDIDNLQIRDQISEHLSVASATPLTHTTVTVTTNNVDDAKSLSEYIPNLSLLNGS